MHGLRRCPGCLPLVIPPRQTCSQVAKPVATRRPAAQGHAFPHGTTWNRSTGPPCTVVQAVAVPRCTGVTDEQGLRQPTLCLPSHCQQRSGSVPLVLVTEGALFCYVWRSWMPGSLLQHALGATSPVSRRENHSQTCFLTLRSDELTRKKRKSTLGQ